MRAVIAFLVAVSGGLTFGQPGEFRAGAFAQDISPTTFPAPVNGNMKGGRADSIHDPMHARCLALSNGTHEIIFCVLDACLVPREVMEKAKDIAAEKTGLPKSHMLMSATHTHSAAAMTPAFQSDPDPDYVATVPARIAEGLIKAHQNLEAAEVGWGSADEPNQVFNRRWLTKQGVTNEDPFGGNSDTAIMNPGYNNPKTTAPSGPTDPQVMVLAVRASSDHRPLALLANYSLHYVGGYPAISADYYGAFARDITEKLHAQDQRYSGKPAFVGIMSNGTSGNINNVNFGAPSPGRLRPGQRLEEVADVVAEAARKAFEGISWKQSATMASTEEDLMLGVRKGTPADLERARELLATIPKDKDGQWSDRRAIYARETTLLDAYPDRVPVKVQAHRINDLSIAAIPCEVFVEIGLDLKQSKPLAGHFTVSLANGYNGYLPTPEHHKLGGYETWRARSSYLEVGASTEIARHLKAMLAKWKP